MRIYFFLFIILPFFAFGQYTGGPGGGASSNSYILPEPPCTNPTDGGGIAADQSVLFGGTVNALTNDSFYPLPPFDGTLEYKWQKSTTSATTGFTDIANTNTEGFTPPAGLTQTTWYRRLVRVDCKADWTGAAISNVVKVEIQNIQTAAIPDGLCPGATLEVGYLSNVTFGSGNTFSVQMSNASGNFSSPTVIGTTVSTVQNGNINVTIPANTPKGTGYRFRITSSNPVFTASDNGIAYTIDTTSTALTGTMPDALCSGNVTITSPTLGSSIKLTGGAGGSTAPYLTLPNTLGATTDFTFETWINLKSYNAWARIFDFGIDDNTYFFFTADYNGSQKPRFAIANGGGNAGEQRLTSSVSIPLNTWTHVAVVISGSTTTGRMYINGQEVATNTSMSWTPATLPETTSNFIGKSQYAADPYLNAELDEMRFWNIARTKEQLETSYNLRFPAGTPGLVSYYKYDEGTGTSSNDAAVSGNKATFVNSVGWVTPSASPSGAYSSYNWSNGGTTQSITINKRNTYTVTVTSSIGCSARASYFADIEPCCTNPTSAGAITNAQTINTGGDPAAITSTALPSGEEGEIEYKWQMSFVSDTDGFMDIADSDTITYNPGILTKTTWYRRLARVSCKTDWTNAAATSAVRIKVLDIPISMNDRVCIGENLTIGYDTEINLLSGNVLTVQLSAPDGSFTNAITLATKTTTVKSGSISFLVPENTPPSPTYKMRLLSTMPTVTATSTVSLTFGFCPANTGKVPNLWLRADKDVTLTSNQMDIWLDQSGSLNHHYQGNATNRPGFDTNSANFNPTATFNGNQWMADPDGILASSKQYTSAHLFLAHRSDTPQSNRGLYGQYVEFGDAPARGLNVALKPGRYMGHGEFNGTQYFGIKSSTNPWVQLPSGPERMNAYVLNTFRLLNGKQDLWFNGGDNFQDDFDHTHFQTAPDVPWSVGVAPAESNSFSAPFSFKQLGKIPEIIVFDEALSEPNRFKLETYLGIKYGTTLLHNYVTSDFNGATSGPTIAYDIETYGNNVAGIGRDDASRLYQKQSRSQNSVPFAGMLTMGADSIASSNLLNPSTLKNNMYLVWGDDQEDPFEVDGFLPGQKMLDRTWKIQATGQVADSTNKAKVDVSFNLSNIQLSLTDFTIMKLIIDRDGDGDFSAVAPDAIQEYDAAGYSTITNVLFKDVTWDTDNNGKDLFKLVTLSYVPPVISKSQYICRNTIPDTLQIVERAKGVSQNAVYQWQISEDSINWRNVGIANSTDEFYPGRLLQTSWYRVITKDQGRSYRPSNAIRMKVVDDIPLQIEVSSIQQPTCNPPQGCKVLLKKLPMLEWTLFQEGNATATYNGEGGVFTISDLPDGAYQFKVASPDGCYATPAFGVIVFTY